MRREMALAMAVVVASGCGVSFVKGSGRAHDDQRVVGAWTTLRVESSVPATVVRGAPQVTLTTDDNVLPDVETFLEGSTLVVRVRPFTQVDSRLGISAVISGDVLEGVEVSGAAVVRGAATPTASFPVAASGSGQVQLTGLAASEVRVDASGSSAVSLAGEADALVSTASGASHVDGRELPVDRARVEGSGASTFILQVASRLDGSLSGSSRLTFSGDAASAVLTSGASSVSRR